jgi:hypothetical protein
MSYRRGPAWRPKKNRERKKETKELMVIGSLCPISVEGLMRRLRWDIGPEGGEALSSHHIWTFILSI